MTPTKLSTSKGAVSPSVLQSLGHAYSAIGKELHHFLIDNPLKAQQSVSSAVITAGSAVITAGKAVVNAVTYGEIHKTLYKPKPTKSDWRFYNDPGTGANNASAASVNSTPTKIKFNLPPHNWSLPFNQNLVSTGVTNPNHALRRARMWCYVGADNSGYTTATGAAVDPTGTSVAASLDTSWGFQFLWNPTQIGTSIQRNANLVPQAMDGFAGRAPLFPGTEALAFVAVIDRVNDFACFKGDPTQAKYQTNMYSKSIGATPNTSQLIDDLMRLGTMADIEYIFKMINGQGTNGTVWRNALGRQTADINFLAPTPVAVQFGPNADSLSYVGWVENISVNHAIFTEDMIPIHSEVTINMSTYSQSSLTSGKNG